MWGRPGIRQLDGQLQGTPPRVWGRHPQRYPAADDGRNTPTHVGKTDFDINQQLADQKHPHACGEDHARENYIFLIKETPPRMWGRRSPARLPGRTPRNTPTHVGKTSRVSVNMPFDKKHPHTCGEDPGICRYQGFNRGNTPTHVGKTPFAYSPISRGQKHPHACGEDCCSAMILKKCQETPPRMWGRHNLVQLYKNQ